MAEVRPEYINNLSGLEISARIKKVADDGESILDGAHFVLSSVDGEVKAPISRQSTDSGVTSLVGQPSLNNYLKLLPRNIRDKISAVRTYDDVISFAKGISGNDFTYIEYANSYHTILATGNRSVMVEMDVPILLEEERSPAGYQKTNVVLTVDARIYFDIQDNSENISEVKASYSIFPENNMYKFNKNIDYDNIVTSSNTMSELLRGDLLSYDDDQEKCSSSSSAGTLCEPVFYVVDEEGDVVLETNNTVNDEHRVLAKKNAELPAKTTVVNSGNASSGNNIITTIIPDGFRVEAETVEAGGRYDESTNTITWNLSYLDPESEAEFSYSIIVPEAVGGGDYVFRSSARSDQFNAESKASELILTVENDSAPKHEDASNAGIANNPATGDIFTIIATAVIACTFVGACLFRKLKHVR